MYKWFYLLLCLIIVTPTQAQYKDQGLGAGIGFGQTFGLTELRDKKAKFMARAFVRYGMVDHIQGELGVGLGRVAGTAYSTQIVPIDYRFIFSPFSFESWNPFLYAGFGALHFDSEVLPPNPTPGAKEKGWTGYAPGGIGIQIRMDDRVSFEASGGLNYLLSDELNAVKLGTNDMFANYQVGLTVVGESGEADPDGDGLTNNEEKQLGTDKKNPDTDGDGLKDGAEVKQHNTNPLKADSDGDTLSDGDEVNTHKTNPNKADSDDDGLSDSAEINTHKTNPNKADSDDDGLADGSEISVQKTNPMNPDTDSDELKDGAEVNTHHTDPLKADTDGGTVNDGIEVGRGTDPLVAGDDVKKEELKVEVGAAIVLDGIVFETGKSDITPESEMLLDKAYNTLAQNADIMVEIHGHTDNTGKRATNTKLSLARAEAVKAWLVKKGIAADRVGTKGFGPDKPIAPNTTKEGRAKNRRIEFFRTK